MSLIECIVQDLRGLPPPILVEISNHIHRLRHPDAEASLRRRAALRATAGSMPGEEGSDFERAVREAADRTDLDE